MNDKILEAEIEILKKVPEENRIDFIEKYGEKMRSILDKDVDERDKEEIENLIIGYRGI